MSTTLLQQINEKADRAFSANATVLTSMISAALPLENNKNYQGNGFDETGMYQLRFKPTDQSQDRDALLDSLFKFLTSAKAKKLGIGSVKKHASSPHSGTFSSVSFQFQDLDYDAVLSKGSNKGESFEKDLVLAMSNLAMNVEDSPIAIAAFSALQAVDSAFRLSNVVTVTPRTGKTSRAAAEGEESGKTIGDMIITLKRGGEKFISIKNRNGRTVGQFGIAGVFNEDLSINKSSSKWKEWMAPCGIDPELVTQGLRAYRDGTPSKFEATVEVNKKLKPGSAVYRLLEKLYGTGYYYLREKGGGEFDAEKIDAETLENTILKGLTITQIRYPYYSTSSKSSKQISVYLESESKRYKIEIRNKGGLQPNELQLAVQ